MKISLVNPEALTNFTKSREVVGTAVVDESILLKSPWSAILLKNGANWLDGSNFKEIQLLVLDIDNDPGKIHLMIPEAIKLFAPYKHIIGTTRNHEKVKVTKGGKEKPATDRYRVLLFFAEPITDSKIYSKNWDKYIEELGLVGTVDSTQDLARFFFPFTSIVSANLEGKLLTVDTTPPAPILKHIPTVLTGKGRLSRKTVDFLAQQPSYDSWHSRIVAAAFDFKAQQYTLEECCEELKRASPIGELDKTDLEQVRDVYVKRESFYAPKQHWPEMTPITPKNPYPKPKKESVKNVEHVISSLLNLTLLYDTRAAKIVKNKEFGDQFTEIDRVSLRYQCLSNNIMHEPSVLDNIVTHKALERRYDPFKKVFEADTWDGKDHIQALFETITFSPDETESNLNWYKQFFERWFRGVAAKYDNPGSQNNVLVFVGAQGLGKSRWLEKLSTLWPDGYKEGYIDPSNKDHALVHLEKYIWHISELDNTTNNKSVSALKEFLTNGVISERRPYAKVPETGRSICSFVASTNSTDFLHDASGNRRYLVLPAISINPEHKVPIAQVFAQALAEYRAGKPYYFTKKECDDMEALTEMYRYKDTFTERLESALKPGNDKLTINDIIQLTARTEDNASYINSKTFKSGISSLLLKKNYRPKNHSNRKVYLLDAEALKAANLTWKN